MIEIKRILCPTDFSDFSRHAFDHAVALARYYEATVTLLHVAHIMPVTAQVHGGVVAPAVALTAADRTALLADMRQFADREAGGAVPVDLDVVQGTPVTEILRRLDPSGTRRQHDSGTARDPLQRTGPRSSTPPI